MEAFDPCGVTMEEARCSRLLSVNFAEMEGWWSVTLNGYHLAWSRRRELCCASSA